MSVRSPENILLYLPPEQEEQVRAVFADLAKLGLPQQFQRPHITITFAQSMSAEAVQVAAQLLPEVIPAEFTRAGTVIFGTRSKQTVTWLLEASDEMHHVAREISAANPDGRGKQWIPHLTVGLRIPRAQVPEYVAGLEKVTPTRFKQLTAARAGWWRPSVQEYTALAED
ncbi:2'-5' RNA ligase family protein [Corynebacterium auriscanis]|uniref:2'-5' RNA ligase family protein n=1 Tax=Corynebacterium auriscanis TaxID=99807 RepID=UPI003CF11C39